jgi:hypothetical protein
MSKAVVVAASLLTLSTLGARPATAGPTMRFGLTGAIDDQGAPGKYEFGPLVALGLRAGPFVGEVEWAYLSFFDPDTTDGGVHRLGVSLRADVFRTYATRCLFRGGCTRAQSLWVEAGAGERFGQWITRPTEMVPLTSPQPEIHIGAGFEMDNELRPHRNGWQLGLRFSMARGDQAETVACRTTGGTCVQTSSGTERALFVEWMFLLGN